MPIGVQRWSPRGAPCPEGQGGGRCRRALPQRAVRPERVVLFPPPLDDYLRLPERVEQLPVQLLIPHLAVKALAVAVLPGRARLDEQRLHADLAEPVPHDMGSELGAIVRPDEIRRTLFNEQPCQAVQHIVGAKLPGDLKRQAFPGELVDDHEDTKRPAFVRSVHDEVI